MSAGLPCIGTDLWAIPEIIGDNKLLIHLPYKPYLTYPNLKYITTSSLLQKYFLLRDIMSPKVVIELSEKIRQLIDARDELKRLRSYVYREVYQGKFSIKQQQNKLKSIYESALRR
jgi:glycosyltransferase involved in cell wall biosynthesis